MREGYARKGKNVIEQQTPKCSHCTLPGSKVIVHTCHYVSAFLKGDWICISFIIGKKHRFASLLLAICPPGIQISLQRVQSTKRAITGYFQTAGTAFTGYQREGSSFRKMQGQSSPWAPGLLYQLALAIRPLSQCIINSAKTHMQLYKSHIYLLLVHI